MAVTSTLAALIGLYFICGGIAMLSDRMFMAGMIKSLADQPLLGYVGGVVAFVIGGTILAVHSIWNGWLAGFVTLIGWISLIKGALLIAAPKPYLQLVSKLRLDGHIVTGLGAVTLALGIALVVLSLV